MSRFIGAIAATVLFASLTPASAGVVVTVDKTAQHLTVSVNGTTRYSWPVSTARWGYRTPVGSYRPERLERQWYSRKYHWSPMPHSIFFHGGYAIHGSYEVSRLGSPASHGCIRLAPANAATLFALVQANYNDTRIVVTGGDGSPAMVSRPSRSIPRETVSASRSRTVSASSARTRYSSAEDFYVRPPSTNRATTESRVVTYQNYEVRPSRGYETVRSYDVRRRSTGFEDIFDEPRRR